MAKKMNKEEIQDRITDIEEDLDYLRKDHTFLGRKIENAEKKLTNLKEGIK